MLDGMLVDADDDLLSLPPNTQDMKLSQLGSEKECPGRTSGLQLRQSQCSRGRIAYRNKDSSADICDGKLGLWHRMAGMK